MEQTNSFLPAREPARERARPPSIRGSRMFLLTLRWHLELGDGQCAGEQRSGPAHRVRPSFLTEKSLP